MNHITIPAEVVPYIRSGAQQEIAGAAEELASVIGVAMDRGAPPSAERRRLLQAWSLVDDLGWPDRPGTAAPVDLDLHEHREALIGALDGTADRLAEMIDASERYPRRASDEEGLAALRKFEVIARKALEREPPARITATMPADVVVELRGALYAELGRACEDALDGMPESKTRAGWSPVLRRLDAALSGLDMIGWAEPSEQQPLTITLDTEMIEVLVGDAQQLEWTSEHERFELAEGRARATGRPESIQRFLASLAERPARVSLMIPSSALGIVREGALGALARVSEAIDSGVDPRDCRQRLTAVCDLLDVIGWCPEVEPTEDVDATEQARVVAEIAAEMVATLKTAVIGPHPGDPERVAAEQDLRLLRQLQAEASGAVLDI